MACVKRRTSNSFTEGPEAVVRAVPTAEATRTVTPPLRAETAYYLSHMAQQTSRPNSIEKSSCRKSRRILTSDRSGTIRSSFRNGADRSERGRTVRERTSRLSLREVSTFLRRLGKHDAYFLVSNPRDAAR